MRSQGRDLFIAHTIGDDLHHFIVAMLCFVSV